MCPEPAPQADQLALGASDDRLDALPGGPCCGEHEAQRLPDRTVPPPSSLAQRGVLVLPLGAHCSARPGGLHRFLESGKGQISVGADVLGE